MKYIKKKTLRSIILSITIISFSEWSHATIDINSDETWSQPTYIADDIVIHNGATLYIVGVQINFSTNSSITVEVGGRLIVNGSTLTSSNPHELWTGIIVKGDKSVYQQPVLRTQGIVNLQNGTIIENAECGVLVGVKSNSGNYLYTNGGGILNATNTIFRNNKEAVCFNEYVYSDPNNHYAEVSNWSRFENCEFIVDNEAEQINQFYCQFMVSLYGVKNVSFKGCHFSNSIGEHTYGIYSNNSSISMNHGYVMYSPTGGYSPYYPQACTFNGFDIAIFLDNSGIRHSIILNTEFEDNRIGVVVRNTDNLRLESSSFVIDEAGILLYQSTFFNIENNVFEAMNHGDGIGIYFEGWVNDNNFIRYNNFQHLCVANGIAGIFSNFSDIYGYAQGLQFKCNQFSDNYDDICVFMPGRIRLLQGSLYDGAGNYFMPPVSDYNIYNHSNNHSLAYYCDMADAHQNPPNVLGEIMVQNSHAVSCIGAGIIGTSYYPDPNVYYDASRIIDWNNVYLDLDAQFTIAFMDYQGTYGLEPIPWKAYYEGDDFYQPQVEAYMELTKIKEEMDVICKDAIHFLIHLPEFNYPEYKLWVSRVGSVQMDFLLAKCYLSENNIIAMNNVLNNMYTRYLEYNPEDISNYGVCLHYLAQWNINDADSVYISQGAIDSLTNIAANGTGASAALANSILAQLNKIHPHVPFAYFCWSHDEGDAEVPPGIIWDDLSIRNNTEKESFSLTILPNPANGYVTISVNNQMFIQEFILHDIYGKVLRTEKVHSSAVDINLSTFSKGIYFITCLLKDGKSVTRKIIKQ